MLQNIGIASGRMSLYDIGQLKRTSSTQAPQRASKAAGRPIIAAFQPSRSMLLSPCSVALKSSMRKTIVIQIAGNGECNAYTNNHTAFALLAHGRASPFAVGNTAGITLDSLLLCYFRVVCEIEYWAGVLSVLRGPC